RVDKRLRINLEPPGGLRMDVARGYDLLNPSIPAQQQPAGLMRSGALCLANEPVDRLPCHFDAFHPSPLAWGTGKSSAARLPAAHGSTKRWPMPRVFREREFRP